MKKIRIGVLGAADIAQRRFLPALLKCEETEYTGVAITERKEWSKDLCEAEYEPLLEKKKEKAEGFVKQFGGKVFVGYEKLLQSEEIDAVYIPLPPALHYRWAKCALLHGKHVFLEKPATVKHAWTQELVELAREKKRILYENYAFCYHKQVNVVRDLINSGEIGELRLLRAAFGFPYRSKEDFRYHRDMGGGALLDCGGYTLKAARLFLGETLSLKTFCLSKTAAHDVDMFGSVTLQNEKGVVAQLSFGMDNAYKCELEVWGSKGYLCAPRLFTPPAELETVIRLQRQSGEDILKVGADDQFLRGIECFAESICSSERQIKYEKEILWQSGLVEEILNG